MLAYLPLALTTNGMVVESDVSSFYYTLILCNDAYNLYSNIACIMNYVTNRNKEREIEEWSNEKSCFYLKQDTSSECKFSE